VPQPMSMMNPGAAPERGNHLTHAREMQRAVEQGEGGALTGTVKGPRRR
jgi:hypothetical protein